MAVIRKPKHGKLTEFYIQNYLFRWAIRYKNHVIGLPNTYVWNWESDFVSVTQSGYAHEYEIKTSRSDFKKDFDKKQKHKLLLENNIYPTTQRPAHFWYVCPLDMIAVDEVPDYAGLLYIRPDGRYVYPLVAKKAPKIWKTPLSEKKLTKLYKGSMWRLWAMREKVEQLEEELHASRNNND